MKVTKSRLKKIIKEEYEDILRESRAAMAAEEWELRRAMKRGSGVSFEDQQKMIDDYWSKRREAESKFATAAGMEQDIEMRRKRGDFEKGDWGVHGPLGYSDKGGMAGEYSDYGEYPWIKSALENLKDEDHMSKEKAVEMLAQELGVSIVTRQEADDALDL